MQAETHSWHASSHAAVAHSGARPMAPCNVSVGPPAPMTTVAPSGRAHSIKYFANLRADGSAWNFSPSAPLDSDAVSSLSLGQRLHQAVCHRAPQDFRRQTGQGDANGRRRHRDAPRHGGQDREANRLVSADGRRLAAESRPRKRPAAESRAYGSRSRPTPAGATAVGCSTCSSSSFNWPAAWCSAWQRTYCSTTSRWAGASLSPARAGGLLDR